MPKQQTWIGRAAVAALVAASLSLPAFSVAQADQPPAAPAHAAKTHPKKHPAAAQRQHPATAQRQQWNGAPVMNSAQMADQRCTWPYRNQFPPCMATWPAGDPNYHGSRPGPTFSDE